MTKPLTPSEASSPMPCRLSGEGVEIGESPDFSRGECQIHPRSISRVSLHHLLTALTNL
ncbi:MAG: hypothetical protein HA495_08910 [Thaumarchaeota archaeon]|nr:hypothetical protein [Nitrososphaerota archaeon]